MCTGFGFKSSDSLEFFGRTMEWGLFDTRTVLTVFPRGREMQGTTPGGKNGKKWVTKYGFVSMNGLESVDFCGDAVNEHGLSVSIFFHPKFASYTPYEENSREDSISAIDFIAYCVSQYKDVEELQEGIKNIRVVNVVLDGFGAGGFPAHFIAKDSKGKCITIEFFEEKIKVFENPLQVITNAPTFDWHMINIQNYLYLSQYTNLDGVNVSGVEISPLGAGSGLLGLPGDFTPVSRFIRAAVFSQTARKTVGTDDTATEVFRILDSFQLPVMKSRDGIENTKPLQNIKSSTAWTTVWDLTNKVLFYHTQYNRRIRRLDFSNFTYDGNDVQMIPLEVTNEQDFKVITF